jgi:hypothetical protein
VKVRMALAALAGVAALATVGVAATATSAGASTIPATVSHISYAPRDCAGWQLSAALTRGPQTWGNNRELVLTLTNTSRSACIASGYPGLRLLTIGYRPLPTTVVQVPARTAWAGEIVLWPGQSATVDITFTVQGRFYPASNPTPAPNYAWPPFSQVSAAYLEVTLPNAHPGYGQQFVLPIPGGPVRIVQDRLYETSLMGHFPVTR